MDIDRESSGWRWALRSSGAVRGLGGLAEVVVAVAAATGVVAGLQSTAPAAGLGVIYLLAVFEVAIRRGQPAALLASLLSVLTLNYLFVPPRHHLSIANSQDVVELIVLLIASVVVGRLASLARERREDAENRAREALAREREAELLAAVATSTATGRGINAQLRSIAEHVAGTAGASGARIELALVPSPGEDETVMELGTKTRRAWLYVTTDTSWPEADLQRLLQPLGRLVDVAFERERIGQAMAEREAARRAEAAKTAVLHAISHDLRSPLTAIRTAASALRSADVSDRERLDLHDVIEGEADRLGRLFDDLLDLSRIEAGAVTPRLDWCDLHDAVASALGHLRREHPVRIELPPELPLVRADPVQLERVFFNLLDNATKFSARDTPAVVSGGATERRVMVSVTNQGRAIPRDDRRRVFEPFFRARDGTGGGSGLGLAICRGFVEANRGMITLQSSTEAGTSFSVSFPTVPQPSAAPHIAEAVPPPALIARGTGEPA